MRRIVSNSPQGLHSLNDLVMDRSYIYIHDTWVTINSIFTIDEPSIPMYFYENSFKYETKELYSFPVTFLMKNCRTCTDLSCWKKIKIWENYIPNNSRRIRRSLIIFDKAFLLVIDRKRSVAEYPTNRTVFLPPLWWKAFRVAPA